MPYYFIQFCHNTLISWRENFLTNPVDNIDISLYGNMAISTKRGGVVMKQLIKVMKAMSEPNRVKILKLLQSRELCVCELQALLNLAQPTISKHLKLLEDAGLVASYKDKLFVNYRLATGKESVYARTLLKSLRGWLKDDPAIADLLLKSLHVHRDTLCIK